MNQFNITKSFSHKQLTSTQRGQIECALNEGKSFTNIAGMLNKDPSTIRKEVKLRTQVITRGRKSCQQCFHNRNCEETNVCGQFILAKGCINCKKCRDVLVADMCQKFTLGPTCKLLLKSPHTCNSCPNKVHCKKTKYLYNAEYAFNDYQSTQAESRDRIKLTVEEVIKIDKMVTPLIQKGQSPAVVYHLCNLSCYFSLPTFYAYIDKRIFTCMNLDLRHKVKLEVSNATKRKCKVSKHREHGRSVEDLTAIERQSDLFSITEIDTVEGCKGGKVLLTVLSRGSHFMFGFLLESKSQKCVIEAINHLESILKNDFKKMFQTTIADNGLEFLDFEGLETSIYSGKRMSIYYARPYCSSDKPWVENNHRLFRYCVPKGYDLSNYSQDDITKIFNMVNNYPRESLNFSTPYNELCKFISRDVLAHLGFTQLSPNEVVLKTYNPKKTK